MSPLRHIPSLTTGLPGLDRVLRGVMAGDNIVWQVQAIEDYQALVTPYAEAARRAGGRLIYFRFADHPALLPADFGAEIHTPDPAAGFEGFVDHVHGVIEEAGPGAMYVFDCLSSLAEAWQADQMLGNFFMLTCPRLLDLETVTYFGIYRNRHTDYAMRAISETTQFLLDVFRCQGRLYVRPVKVQHRSTASMNLIHAWEGETFRPVSESAVVSEILAASQWPGLQADTRIGYWRRLFGEARGHIAARAAGHAHPAAEAPLFARLSHMLLGAEPDSGVGQLIARYLTLDDLVAVRDRMIGIGPIGGKSVGMLLARAVLRLDAPDLAARLEAHDSFYVGAEVFHTFLVRNRLWWSRQQQRKPESFLKGLDVIREKMLSGNFPDHTVEQFSTMLDYFGEWPFIVRSSSLLEDNYGNAFAGKYDSVFCVNQGPREKRLAELLDAVRRVYASTLSERALTYRARRGLLDRDEQMALLVMRVSGSAHGRYFYPQAAGVGLSFNPYPWNPRIDPQAGVVRLVFGLGTRAVDRSDDDYTRLVALNAPELRPESNFEEVAGCAQRRMDSLDIEANRLVSAYFTDIVGETADFPVEMFASQHQGEGPRVLTFDRLLGDTDFVSDLRRMLRGLHDAYAHPVEIEFTLNFLRDGGYRIHLLQCRPLQVRGTPEVDAIPANTAPEDRVIESQGAVIGLSRTLRIDRLVYVTPAAYAALPQRDRYEIARIIGRINRAGAEPAPAVMYLGPGRWGTSDPSLGIPVNFSEINRAAVICEIVAMRDSLVPDVSLGTHFLNELVEMDMLYLALFPKRTGNRLDEAFFAAAPNRLAALSPEDARWSDLVRVVDAADFPSRGPLVLHADALHQNVVVAFSV